MVVTTLIASTSTTSRPTEETDGGDICRASARQSQRLQQEQQRLSQQQKQPFSLSRSAHQEQDETDASPALRRRRAEDGDRREGAASDPILRSNYSDWHGYEYEIDEVGSVDDSDDDIDDDDDDLSMEPDDVFGDGHRFYFDDVTTNGGSVPDLMELSFVNSDNGGEAGAGAGAGMDMVLHELEDEVRREHMADERSYWHGHCCHEHDVIRQGSDVEVPLVGCTRRAADGGEGEEGERQVQERRSSGNGDSGNGGRTKKRRALAPSGRVAVKAEPAAAAGLVEPQRRRSVRKTVVGRTA